MEDIQISTIVNHSLRCVLHEGLAGDISHPLANGNKGNIGQCGEQRFFLVVVLPRPVKEHGCRIAFFTRTIIASRFPFHAVVSVKKSTMPCKRPTVMKCPNNWDICFCKIIEKYLDVQIIAMNIMKIYYIRLDALDFLNELFRCSS